MKLKIIPYVINTEKLPASVIHACIQKATALLETY